MHRISSNPARDGQAQAAQQLVQGAYKNVLMPEDRRQRQYVTRLRTGMLDGKYTTVVTEG